MSEILVKSALLLTLAILIGSTTALRMRGAPYVGLANEHKRPVLSKFGSVDAETRIVGGEQVEVGYSPWTVSLANIYYYHFCAGAIIDKLHILTAASCVAGLRAKNVHVLTGTSSWWNETSPEYNVDEIILHCNFDKPLYHNDIALLKLSKPIEFDDVTKAVPLADLDELEEGEKLTFVGWGETAIGESLPADLHKVVGTYLPYEECKIAHGGSDDVDLGHVCSKQEIGKGACHSDTGGPLVNEKGVLVGISNWGVPCGYGFPDVYARVSFYNDWIRTTINGCAIS